MDRDRATVVLVAGLVVVALMGGLLASHIVPISGMNSFSASTDRATPFTDPMLQHLIS